MLVTALNLEDMRAFDLAEQARQIKEDVAIVVLAEMDDPEMSPEEQHDYGIVYLQQPLDVYQFSQVIFAGMHGEDMFAAMQKPATDSLNGDTLAPVPAMNIERAQEIIDRLVSELLAMSVLLIDREGHVLLERGPSANYIDRTALTKALQPSLRAVIDMRDLVGGEATTLQFYDGDNRDVYALSVGLHHMLCIAFDGEKGQREFGAVNRFGRKGAMDLIALLGAEAFLLRRVEPEKPAPKKRETIITPAVEAEETVKLERAEGFDFEEAGTELEKLEMEPIPEEAFDASFLDNLDSLDPSAADDLFSLDNLGNAAASLKSQRTISEDEAFQLGILGKDLGDD